MKQIKRIYITLILIVACKSYGQFDPMYTQYMYNESSINPAYAGSHKALSFSALARMQWVGIDGSPKTQTFNAHAPLKKEKIGVGINIVNESIGVQKRTGGALNFAYRIKLKSSTLCFGVQAGVVSFIDNFSKVSTVTQNDQQFIANSQRLTTPNFGAGVYYYTKKFYVGLSIPRMIENKMAIGGGASNKVSAKSFHYFLAMGYVYDVNTQLAIKPTIMIKATQNAPLQGELTVQAIMKNSLWVGLAYRSGDAISALLGYQINPQFKIGYSYDYTLSKLRKYNSGSHELMLNYILSYNKSKVHTPRYLYQKF